MNPSNLQREAESSCHLDGETQVAIPQWIQDAAEEIDYQIDKFNAVPEAAGSIAEIIFNYFVNREAE